MIATATTVLLTLGTGLAGGFSGWFFSRKRQNIENIDMALGTWQKVIDSLESRVEMMLNKVDELTRENYELREQVEVLRAELATRDRIEKQVKALERKIQKYEKLLADNNIAY